MVQVLNLRTATVEQLRNAIRIDRQTRWGNPHRIGRCNRCNTTHDRIGAVSAYIRDLQRNPALVAAIRLHGKGKAVACWCAPDLCHGQPFIEVANSQPGELSWLIE